ncbi:MAG TPA: SMC family ATPase, partial [Acidimicrobiales bacterium]|nr:SMC family ATPase [Acidimicrobiales bacterium]
MKPHHLVIEALGPYPGTEEVDFDALAGEGLFLLHGPTGSGKTFVLDAIAFALYGSIPGARTTDGIRSDFAPPGARPSVTLEFTAQGHRYRVERSPGHERPKLRGSGTTTESHKAVLQVRDGSGWSPVAAKPTEVSREIQNLLGLDVEQFKQVVMLPQGGFQKVLRAGSDKREELLKTLFDIRSFDTFTKWLEDRAREARKSEETARTLLDDLVTRTRAAHRDLADRLGVEPPSETPEDEAPTDLAVLVEEALEWARTAARRAADAGRRAEAARTRLEVARARMKLWEQRAAARRELAQLQERAGEVARIEARLARATEAEGLRADLDAVEEAEAALADAEAELSAAVPNLARTLDAAPLLPPAAGRLVGDLPPTDDQAVEALEALAAHGARLKELALRRERAEELRRAADHSRREARSLRERSETVEREARSTASRLEAARVELQAAVRRAERLPELQRRREEQVRRRRLEDDLAAAREAVNGARTAVEALEARREEARVRLEDLRHRFVAGVAGRLARDLVEGVGCPVCGSTHHPHPARPTA